MPSQPNILIILNDDMGYSDLGCYGGEIRTPNLDRLAAGGLRMTQFYNTARCCPSRASLLTGLHPHQADVGDMVGNDQVDGYLGDLSRNAATIAEVLGGSGYRCLMSGKWHVTGDYDSKHNWPCQRGFEEYYGMLTGAGSYYAPKTLTRDNTPIDPPDDKDFYFTDAISDEAVGQLERHFERKDDRPFFQYLAYTAPHWPLHALPEDIERYRGRYDSGWDVIRQERLERMEQLGLLQGKAALSPRDESQPAWEDAEDKEWQARRMEVYAAQIDRMDQGIGRVLGALEARGQLDNTLVIFLADNGGCHEVISENWGKRLATGLSGRTHTRDGKSVVRYGNTPDIVPGPEDTYGSYGIAWANVSNTPFRKYKCWVHEGGISTPFIVHWPAGIDARGELRHDPAQLPDVMATCVDVAGAAYPERIGERDILPQEGCPLTGTFAGRPHGREVLTWEHEGNAGVRKGRWKLVREFRKKWEADVQSGRIGPGPQPWELYDIEADRSELNDLAGQHPDVVRELEAAYQAWAARCKVRPFEEIIKLREEGKSKPGKI